MYLVNTLALEGSQWSDLLLIDGVYSMTVLYYVSNSEVLYAVEVLGEICVESWLQTKLLL